MNTRETELLIASARKDNLSLFKDIAGDLPGFRMRFALDANTAKEIIDTVKPNIVFCDLQLQYNGSNTIIKNYLNGYPPPDFLICITATEEERYAERSLLKEGADDFIVTPTSKKLLLKKIEALRRRIPGRNETEEIPLSEDISLSLQAYTVNVKGTVVTLPKIEFNILKLFALNPGKTFTREEIRKEIWPKNNDVHIRTVDVHIYNLRAKILPEIIQTIERKGYMLKGTQNSELTRP